MTKNGIILLLVLLLQSCGATKPNTSTSIFRHIDLGRFGKIELQDELHQFDALITTKNQHYFLNEKVFDGAETIELLPDETGKITAIIFQYASEINIKSKVEHYQYLGKPSYKNKRFVWQDGKTKFELYKKNNLAYAKLTHL